MNRFSPVFAALALAVSAFALDAQPVDSIQIAYVSNLNQGDSAVNITNGGANGAFLGVGGSNGDFCVNVYVFDPAQELLACCSCLVTPDGLNSFSVKNDLINHTLTPAVPTAIVIKLTATAPSNGATTCSNTAAKAFGSGNYLQPGMRAWATTLHQNPQGGYSVTENAFQNVTIGQAEASALPMFCGFVLAEGSQQFGFCNNACRNNGLTGSKK